MGPFEGAVENLSSGVVPRAWPILADSGHLAANVNLMSPVWVAEISRHLWQTTAMLSKSFQLRSTLGPTSSNVGQALATAGRLRPILVNVGPTWFGPDPAERGRVLSSTTARPRVALTSSSPALNCALNRVKDFAAVRPCVVLAFAPASGASGDLAQRASGRISIKVGRSRLAFQPGFCHAPRWCMLVPERAPRRCSGCRSMICGAGWSNPGQHWSKALLWFRLRCPFVLPCLCVSLFRAGRSVSALFFSDRSEPP